MLPDSEDKVDQWTDSATTGKTDERCATSDEDAIFLLGSRDCQW